MRLVRHAYFVIGIPFQILACSTEPATVRQAPPAASAPSPASGPETPGPVTAPIDIPPVEADRSNIDLFDPAALTRCAEIATRPENNFTADAAFGVTGALKVASTFDDVQRLTLSFDWPSKRVNDGDRPWRLDARTNLALELLDPRSGFAVSTSSVPVRVWKFDRIERACTTEHRQVPPPRPTPTPGSTRRRRSHHFVSRCSRRPCRTACEMI